MRFWRWGQHSPDLRAMAGLLRELSYDMADWNSCQSCGVETDRPLEHKHGCNVASAQAYVAKYAWEAKDS